jgi:hypothetical protein
VGIPSLSSSSCSLQIVDFRKMSQYSNASD